MKKIFFVVSLFFCVPTFLRCMELGTELEVPQYQFALRAGVDNSHICISEFTARNVPGFAEKLNKGNNQFCFDNATIKNIAHLGQNITLYGSWNDGSVGIEKRLYEDAKALRIDHLEWFTKTFCSLFPKEHPDFLVDAWVERYLQDNNSWVINNRQYSVSCDNTDSAAYWVGDNVQPMHDTVAYKAAAFRNQRNQRNAWLQTEFTDDVDGGVKQESVITKLLDLNNYYYCTRKGTELFLATPFSPDTVAYQYMRDTFFIYVDKGDNSVLIRDTKYDSCENFELKNDQLESCYVSQDESFVLLNTKLGVKVLKQAEGYNPDKSVEWEYGDDTKIAFHCFDKNNNLYGFDDAGNIFFVPIAKDDNYSFAKKQRIDTISDLKGMIYDTVNHQLICWTDCQLYTKHISEYKKYEAQHVLGFSCTRIDNVLINSASTKLCMRLFRDDEYTYCIKDIADRQMETEFYLSASVKPDGINLKEKSLEWFLPDGSVLMIADFANKQYIVLDTHSGKYRTKKMKDPVVLFDLRSGAALEVDLRGNAEVVTLFHEETQKHVQEMAGQAYDPCIRSESPQQIEAFVNLLLGESVRKSALSEKTRLLVDGNYEVVDQELLERSTEEDSSTEEESGTKEDSSSQAPAVNQNENASSSWKNYVFQKLFILYKLIPHKKYCAGIVGVLAVGAGIYKLMKMARVG